MIGEKLNIYFFLDFLKDQINVFNMQLYVVFKFHDTFLIDVAVAVAC